LEGEVGQLVVKNKKKIYLGVHLGPEILTHMLSLIFKGLFWAKKFCGAFETI
jgi:hypothetical protein